MRFVNRWPPLAAATALLVTGTVAVAVAVPVAGATARQPPAAVTTAVTAAGRPPAAVTTARKAVVKTVKVADDFYSPTKLTIRAGDKVNFVWAPTNVNTHNVTLISAPKGVSKKQFTSLDGSINFHFERTFTVPGKYHFQCTIHPAMMNFFLTVKQ
jgi:plastocyanin